MFNDAVSGSDYKVSRIEHGRKRSWPNLICYPDILVERVSNTIRNVSQDSRDPARFEPVTSEYKSEVYRFFQLADRKIREKLMKSNAK
jgi:hypothetical protein